MRFKQLHWLGLGALTGTAIAASILDFQFEETYRSEVVLRLQTPPQWASTTPTTSEDLAHVINLVAQEALSRRNLKAIIEANHLYADRLNRVPLDDVIDDMRLQSVRIGGADKNDKTVVKLSFKHPDPLLAQRTTQALLKSIIDGSRRAQASNTSITLEFLESRVAQAACDWEAAASVSQRAHCKPSGK